MLPNQYIDILKLGVSAWNRWREENPKLPVDLSGLELKSLDLRGINLKNALLKGTNFFHSNLSGAILDGANCRNAIFINTNFRDACLISTYLGHSNLQHSCLNRANLSQVTLTEAVLNYADLSDANLEKANCIGANFSRANFSRANLVASNLLRVEALATNFFKAVLTGACIAKWNIDSETNLRDVDCEFIYLGWSAGDVFKDRCPIDRNFSDGEFTRRFRIPHNILELAFNDGMPWKAFAYAFADINLHVLDEYGSELFLREYKVLDEGLVILKIGYPPEADGNKIRESLELKTMQLRELELHNIYLKGELKSKDETLTRLERVLLPEFSRFGAKSSRIYLDDIQSFQKIRLVDFKSIESFLQVNGYLDVSEDEVQNALESILNEKFHKKDWGGEYNDLYTSNLIFEGSRRATAFLLKGNGLRAATMEIKHCGKNGDQLIRLFESPAELFIVQFVGNMSEAIVKDVEGKVEQLRARGKEAYYCIVNGTDTARLLYAYDLLNI